MNDKAKLFWLASYPKSGNTWTRAFIANLVNEESGPVDINEFNTGAIASSRSWIQTAFDFDIDELDHDETDALRPLAYNWLNEQADNFAYHKTHDAYSYLDKEKTQPLFPNSATAGALLIVRNPLDVVVSFAHHSSCSIEQTIKNMQQADFAFCAKEKKLHNQLRQWLWSWSAFNRSWMQAPVPKMVVRYEDMKTDPINTFTRIASFLHLPDDTASVADAVEKCRIENLQSQEKSSPFKERPAKAKSFFRKGIVGDWQNKLTEQQVKQVIDAHYELMLELNYINEQGEPV
jgi:hypothetical protein